MNSRAWVISAFPDAHIRTCTDSWTTIYAEGRKIGEGRTPGAAWLDATRAIKNSSETVSAVTREA